MLKKHHPLVSAMTFIGQSSVKTKGLSQKEQTRIVREFREGNYNCLVATCIGEEGLGMRLRSCAPSFHLSFCSRCARALSLLLSRSFSDV